MTIQNITKIIICEGLKALLYTGSYSIQFTWYYICYIFRAYNRYSNENDIGLMFLTSPFELSENIDIACLPTPNFEPENGARCVISGWGTMENGFYAKSLKWAVIPMVSDKDCANQLPSGWWKPSMVCAGGAGNGERGTDTCQGDSGGPLVCLVNDSATLIGVTSWGQGCGESPGLYSDVGKLIPWVEEKLNRFS